MQYLLIIIFLISCSNETLPFLNSEKDTSEKDTSTETKKDKDFLQEDKDDKLGAQEDLSVETQEEIDDGLNITEYMELTDRGLQLDDMIMLPHQIYKFKMKQGLYAAQAAEELELANIDIGIRSTAWPQGVIAIAAENSTPSEISQILDACNEWAKTANITCKMRTDEKDFVRVYHENTGCHASLGRFVLEEDANVLSKITKVVDGLGWVPQKLESHLNLQRSKFCFKRGTIIHEFGHLLGFVHEQARPDRDSYIKINKSNITLAALPNFMKLDTTHYSSTYDFKSIMHYGPYAASKNGNQTISAHDQYKAQEVFMGGRDYPSSFDRNIAEEIYGRKEVIEENVQAIDSETGVQVVYEPVENNNTRPVYRGFEGSKGHIHTRFLKSVSEYGFNYEGIGFNVFETFSAGRVPLYDCIFGGNRHYSDLKGCVGEKLVGIIGYIYPGTNDLAKKQLYRCYNGFSHLSTTNRNECTAAGFDNIATLGFVP